MIDTLIVLAAMLTTAFYYYGERALRLTLIGIASAVLCELIGSKLFSAEAHISDLTAVVTGASIALCLPASSEWWLPCAASAFAVLAVRIPFGDYRNTLFIPSAAGLAFVTVCSSQRVFGYSLISQDTAKAAVYGSEEFIRGDSVAFMLSRGNSIGNNIISYIDILVGNIPGPMGAACALAVFGGLVYMIIRRPKNALISLSFLAVCFIYALIFPRVTTGRLTSAFMELTAGLLLFAAAVWLTDDAVAPKRLIAKVCYGAFAGLVLMLLRSFSGFEDSTVFAVLLANAVAPAFDNRIPMTAREKAAEKKASAETVPTDVRGGEQDG